VKCSDCGVEPRHGLVLITMRGVKGPWWLCGRCWIKRGKA
jgi:hypothetical protein